MAMIEEIAKKIIHKKYSGWDSELQKWAIECCEEAATEQDRIARKEERERCIKVAIEAHCKLCSGIHRCRFDGENYRDGNGFICSQPDFIKVSLEE